MIQAPLLPDSADADQYTRVLVRKLSELFRDYANEINKATTPPLLIANRNGVDLALTVNSTNTIVWTTKVVDTHAWFDTSTGKFTPKRPGYYRVTLQCEAASGAAWPSGGFAQSMLRLNGSEVASTYWISNGVNSGSSIPPAVYIISCNGSTDYIDTAIKNAGTPTTPKLGGATNRSWLLIEFVR